MDEVLKPWYAVATPHPDIREGRLDEAVFAANLWAVTQNEGPEVYLDPEQFFRKTYMTEGLKSLLQRVAKALSGEADAGDRIISLQTVFGGGKTHALVALWHLAKHGARLKKSPYAEELRSVLGGHFPEGVRGVAVFTNQTCDATQGRQTPEGIRTRTLWGELALQLGGPALYEKVRANDEAQSVPQGIFQEVLREAAPCLILLDELADYCVGAAGVAVGETTLADQTISFIQQLTEAVQQVPGTAVVATLPASKFEVAQSENGHETFITLEKRFQRLGADVKPVGDDEIYEVVRRRLFESIAPPEEPDYPEKVARYYQEMYEAHRQEVAPEAAKLEYRKQIARAYPFHPQLIDAFYTRWGSHSDFQRTRGVLRLLASIVGDLWRRRSGNAQTQHLIQPCHVNWELDALQGTLTRLWGDAFQSVVAADICGDKSNARAIDAERGGDYEREAIAQGAAAAILLGSFGGQGGKSSFSAKDLRVACSRAGLNWGYLDGALTELENRCFYLHTAPAGNLGKRYWFGTKPTLNKLVVQYRQQFEEEQFEEEIREDLRNAANEARRNKGPDGPTWNVVVDPGPELSEQKSLTLVVLPPSLPWEEGDRGKGSAREYVLKTSQFCGSKTRNWRNTLVFLAATPRGLSKARQHYRDKKALEAIKRDYWEQLDEEQRRDLEERLKKAEAAAKEALARAYSVAMRVEGQEVKDLLLTQFGSDFADHLVNAVWKTLVDEEWILRRVGSVTLEKVGLVPSGDGTIPLKDAIEAFLRFTDKPIIAEPKAVTLGLQQACRDGIVGLARGTSKSTLQVRYCRQEVSLEPTEEGLWIIPPFDPNEPKPVSREMGAASDAFAASAGQATMGGTMAASAPPIAGGGGAQGGVASGVFESPAVGTPAAAGFSTSPVPGAARTIKRLTVHGEIPIENYPMLFDSFVRHANTMRVKKLGVQLVMNLQEHGGLDASDPMVEAFKEAAKQLGLTLDIEE